MSNQKGLSKPEISDSKKSSPKDFDKIMLQEAHDLITKIYNEVKKIDDSNILTELIKKLNEYINNLYSNAQFTEANLFQILSLSNTIIYIGNYNINKFTHRKNIKNGNGEEESSNMPKDLNLMAWRSIKKIWHMVKKNLQNICSIFLTFITPTSWSISGQFGFGFNWLLSSNATIQINFGK